MRLNNYNGIKNITMQLQKALFVLTCCGFISYFQTYLFMKFIFRDVAQENRSPTYISYNC